MQHLFWLFMISARSCDFFSRGGREEAQCVCWPGAEMAFQRHSPSTESSQDPSPCKLRDCWSGGKSRSVGRTSQLLGIEEKLEALRSLGRSYFLSWFAFPFSFLFPFLEREKEYPCHLGRCTSQLVSTSPSCTLFGKHIQNPALTAEQNTTAST